MVDQYPWWSQGYAYRLGNLPERRAALSQLSSTLNLDIEHGKPLATRNSVDYFCRRPLDRRENETSIAGRFLVPVAIGLIALSGRGSAQGPAPQTSLAELPKIPAMPDDEVQFLSALATFKTRFVTASRYAQRERTLHALVGGRQIQGWLAQISSLQNINGRTILSVHPIGYDWITTKMHGWTTLFGMEHCFLSETS
jgi:hypothetical protein